MTFVITPDDRSSFGRCRRQWDFGATERGNLEPAAPPDGPDLGRAVRDALDIYYFPGMWDWDRRVTLPLVIQGFDRAVSAQRERLGAAAGAAAWDAALDTGRSLLGRYFDWAPGVDLFSPVLVEGEYEVNVPDPDRPAAGLVTAAGEAVRFRGRVDMLAVDRHDAYWIVRHRVTGGDWLPDAQLLGDEEAAAACWAWENFYLGMTIAGTVYNELRLVPRGAGSSSVAGTSSVCRDRPRCRDHLRCRTLPPVTVRGRSGPYARRSGLRAVRGPPGGRRNPPDTARNPGSAPSASTSRAAAAGRSRSTGGCTPGPASPARQHGSSNTPVTDSAAPGCAASLPRWQSRAAGWPATWPR
jgi:hypothetical protein